MDEHTMSDLDLMDLEIATVFTHDAAGRMVADNEPDGEPAPRFFLGRTREGNVWRVRYDVSEQVVGQLAEVVTAEPVPDDLEAPIVNLDAMLDALRLDHEPVIGHQGPSYRFPGEIIAPGGVTRISQENLQLLQRMVGRMDALERDFDHVEPWMAMVVEGAAVASCYSRQLSNRAAEARVDTLDGYRGRGYATAVVATWARAVRESGRIPFYGTSWDNTASQAVARKLGLVQYAVGLSVE